jgi:hypothetical protein
MEIDIIQERLVHLLPRIPYTAIRDIRSPPKSHGRGRSYFDDAQQRRPAGGASVPNEGGQLRGARLKHHFGVFLARHRSFQKSKIALSLLISSVGWTVHAASRGQIDSLRSHSARMGQ